jgi:hypothetical protein
MARMMQSGSPTIPFMQIEWVIMRDHMTHPTWRIKLLFNKNKPFTSAFKHELLTRF